MMESLLGALRGGVCGGFQRQEPVRLPSIVVLMSLPKPRHELRAIETSPRSTPGHQSNVQTRMASRIMSFCLRPMVAGVQSEYSLSNRVMARLLAA